MTTGSTPWPPGSRVADRPSSSCPRSEIKKIALSRPVDHDPPFSTWSLTRLAEFLVPEGVVDDISHDGLRMLLRE